MPLERCELDSKPGWRFGGQGACYTYTAGDDASELAARKKAIRQGLAVGGGKPPPEGFTEEEQELLAALAADDTSDVGDVNLALETEDMLAVPILRAGGPYFGHGSKQGGDYFTTADLERYAAATRLLMGRKELTAPNKVGHSDDQKLLRASGYIDEDEQPAGGWLDNVRVDGDQVIADLRRVPKKLAELIRVGAFRKRSAELRTLTSQTDGKDYRVIAGLGWLGAKAPAVRTLDDIAALYADDAEGEALLWLDEEPPDSVRYVNYEPEEEHTMTPKPADTSVVDAKTKLTDEHITALAEAYEIAEDDPAKRRDAVEAKLAEALAPETKPEEKPAAETKPEEKPDDKPNGGASLSEAELEVLRAKAERGDRVFEERRQEKRAEAIEKALHDGRIDPAKREFWERQFTEIDDDARVVALLEEMPVNEEFARVYGADDDGLTPEARSQADDTLYKEYVEFVGGND